MKAKAATLVVVVAFASILFAAEGPVPKGVPHLDHVWVIMMENHGFGQVIGNANMPFTNKYALKVNSARNYFAVGGPTAAASGARFSITRHRAKKRHSALERPRDPSCA